MRFHYFLAVFLKFSVSIISDRRMASGSAPAGERGVINWPLLPEGEVPRGRGRGWLTVNHSKCPNRV